MGQQWEQFTLQVTYWVVRYKWRLPFPGYHTVAPRPWSTWHKPAPSPPTGTHGKQRSSLQLQRDGHQCQQRMSTVEPLLSFFLQTTHRYSKANPLRWAMDCPFWVHSLIYISHWWQTRSLPYIDEARNGSSVCAKEILGVRNATFEENPHENEGIWIILMCAISFIALQNMVAWGSG